MGKVLFEELIFALIVKRDNLLFVITPTPKSKLRPNTEKPLKSLFFFFSLSTIYYEFVCGLFYSSAHHASLFYIISFIQINQLEKRLQVQIFTQ